LNTKLHFDYIWIPSFLGGHNSSPYCGMRVTIRWQKYISEFLQCARDVQWEAFSLDEKTLQGKATCNLISGDPLPENWLREGELIEFLNGHRVLAIGKLTLQASVENCVSSKSQSANDLSAEI